MRKKPTYSISTSTPSSPATSCSIPSIIPSKSFLTEINISSSDTYNALICPSVLIFPNPSKASGLDGVGPKLLQSCAVALCGPLHHLFNLSPKKNFQIPLWVASRLHHPIFKLGDRTSVSNYRPISLLFAVSKFLERLVYNKSSTSSTALYQPLSLEFSVVGLHYNNC